MMRESKERLVLTGASGFLGGYLARTLAERYEVWALTRPRNTSPLPASVKRLEANLEEPGFADRLIWLRPSFVIHAAAVSRPDECERDKRRAM